MCAWWINGMPSNFAKTIMNFRAKFITSSKNLTLRMFSSHLWWGNLKGTTVHVYPYMYMYKPITLPLCLYLFPIWQSVFFLANKYKLVKKLLKLREMNVTSLWIQVHVKRDCNKDLHKWVMFSDAKLLIVL